MKNNTFDECLFNSFATGLIASLHNLHWTLPSKPNVWIISSSGTSRSALVKSTARTFSFDLSKLIENEDPSTINKIVSTSIFPSIKFGFFFSTSKFKIWKINIAFLFSAYQKPSIHRVLSISFSWCCFTYRWTSLSQIIGAIETNRLN